MVQNWHLHILSNRPLKAKRLTINGLLKAQIFAIFRPIENLFSNMRFSWGSLSRKFISNHVQGEQTWLEGVIPRSSPFCLYFRPNSVNLPKFVVLYKLFRTLGRNRRISLYKGSLGDWGKIGLLSLFYGLIAIDRVKNYIYETVSPDLCVLFSIILHFCHNRNTY